ncbi:hypothetical protein BDZ91DRAFT_735923 [Kalaharituber pfeilii]|nr:hypothetical protein BDZ91DRAFT_735923 [Kalaharituber pfeilii]
MPTFSGTPITSTAGTGDAAFAEFHGIQPPAPAVRVSTSGFSTHESLQSNDLDFNLGDGEAAGSVYFGQGRRMGCSGRKEWYKRKTFLYSIGIGIVVVVLLVVISIVTLRGT